MGDFPKLNPLLHSELRLAILSLLVTHKKGEFTWLKEQTGATSGNLSVQISKLENAGYLKVEKTFKKNYPLTTCAVTKKGIKSFEEYVNSLKFYINLKSKK